MTETAIQFWSGLNTIGGNIISLQYGNYRIITDFGAMVGANVDDLLDRRFTSQLLKDEKLPKIPGLYAKQALKDVELESLEESDVETIICLSHLHLDHLGSFGQLSTTVPIYALKDSVEFYGHLKENELLPSYAVDWHSVEDFGTVQHGPFTIQFIPVDHDTLGAASMFITAPDVKVIYSGDFRLSGFHPEKTLTWAQQARAFDADILLIEGTTFSHMGAEPTEVDLRIEQMTRHLKAENEQQLLTRLKHEMAQATDQSVAFNGYPQNITRLIRFAKIVNEYGRQLVLDKRYYHLMKAYVTQPLDITYIGKGGIDIERINEAPHKFALQVDVEDLTALFSVKPGLYFHSNGMPLGSYDPTYEPFVRRVVDSGWEFVLANVGGHASPNDLLLVNRVINPKLVVPWHTYQPKLYGEAMAAQGQNVWWPSSHQTYYWSQLSEKSGATNEKN